MKNGSGRNPFLCKLIYMAAIIGGGVFGGTRSAIAVKPYVYIDGEYLRRRLHDCSQKFCNGEEFQLDYAQFFLGFEKKFYYDCLPPHDDPRFETRQNLFEQLSRLPGFHVVQGKTVSEGARARQKGVDVHLAVHMLDHAWRQVVRNVTLLAGDGDFVPLVRAVVAQGSYVTLQFDRTSISQDLIKAADEHREIELNRYFQCAKSEFRKKYPAARERSAPEIAGLGDPIKKGFVKESGGAALLFRDGEGLVLVFPHQGGQKEIKWWNEDLLLAQAQWHGATIKWIEK